LADVTVLRGVEALNQAVDQKRAGLTGKRQCLLCDLFNGHAHGRILLFLRRKLNPADAHLAVRAKPPNVQLR
jgi:hypothetical protein